MPAHVTTDSLAATAKVAPVSAATVWRWLVLLPRKWAHSIKVSRDTEMLRHAPRERLADIGISRSEIGFVCEYGRLPN